MRHFMGSDPIGALFTQAFADLRDSVRVTGYALTRTSPSSDCL